MSFDWLQYLELAKNLSSDPNNPGPREAALRSATSNAYYSAFNLAVHKAATDGYSPHNTGEDHFAVRRFYNKYDPSSPDRKKISVELNRLYSLRAQADYSPNLSRSAKSLAEHAIIHANAITNILKKL